MTIHIVAGGQFGSEGKGAFTAALVRKLSTGVGAPPVLVRVAGPNAGHTAYDDEGRKWSLRQIPVGAVANLDSPIVIGQQSEIDMEVLAREIEMLESAGIGICHRLRVDREATVISADHLYREVGITSGTTGKGIGAARAARAMREARLIGYNPIWAKNKGIKLCDTVNWLRLDAPVNSPIVIEGTQGYGLGLHTSYYPHTTSTNCRPGDFLAMTGLQPWECGPIVPWLVFRSNPIRIAGASGPLHAEIGWGDIGVPVEYTTVTRKPRRVGQWDDSLAREAIAAAGGAAFVRVAYNFADYVIPSLSGQTEWSIALGVLANNFEREYNVVVQYVGTGPTTGVWRGHRTWTSNTPPSKHDEWLA